ncbi:hypothetical protein CORC01_04017 [Colletotrichum orchidophilum]|uniref:Uncharacterized protein n=1 Tax=Colletotrichum orchidophilum TaxID=1209926 RepID=A0A1G4BGS6_9PEZI|nr:uncharacterized protein CORC01_04017 [Colletotrichum orchidophilum]OHF00700.1 hypothetical protein CORC01_04017 [Colletotrichum orchidophilum]
MESILEACLALSKNSRAQASNLLIVVDGVATIHEPKEFFKAGTYFINGDEIYSERSSGLHYGNLKGGYKYEFKYVPQYDVNTGAETADGLRPAKGVFPF